MKKILSFFALMMIAVAIQAQNPFFEVVNYRGAFAPAPAAPWTDGWTNWDPQNTTYGSSTVTVNSAITTNTTWTSNNVYLIQGVIYVKNGATLTIQPGTVILGDKSIANSSLVISKGAKINAVGTSSNPIVFTSNQAAGSRAVGDWGGVIILGKATLNRPGGTANIEGITAATDNEYGGGANPDNEDNSGNLKYVRIEYGGYVFATDQEINGLTLGAVGRNTIIDYVQCSFINDDAFEWFGGTVNASHLVAYRCLDDDFDTDFGYSGSVQFALSVRDPQISDQSSASTSEGFESDTDGGTGTSTPATTCVFSNVTVVGPFRGTIIPSPAATFDFKRAARIRRGTQMKLLNSILMDFPVGVFLDGPIVRANLATGATVFKDNIVAGCTRAAESTMASSLVDSVFNSTKFGNDSLVSTSGILVTPYDYTNPDYRPAAGSPALSGVNFTDAAFNNRKIVITSRSFIKEVSFRGAFAPSPAVMWTDGWTNWDPNSTIYPSATVTVNSNITTNTTWTASNTYLISGTVYVTAGVTLTIEPGTVILGDKSVAKSALIITKNAKLNAEGTLSNPIVFTSNQAPGQRAIGDWGGLIVLGRATLNRPGGTANIEGIETTTNTEYGGGAAPNDDDNSGIIKYVRIEFGGYVFASDQEINGLTLGAVGRGTVVDYVQVSYTNDDAFEWFGGSVNCAHLVAYRNLDDDFDTDFGYSGSVQFALSVRDPQISDQSSGSTSEGFESDTDGGQGTSTPATTCLFSNVTVVGPFRGTVLTTWPANYKFRRAARIRRGTQLKLFNSILMDFPYGVHIDGPIVRSNLQTGLTKFKNNLVAGSFLAMEPGTASAVRDSIFGSGTGLFKNDSLSTTANVLVSPYNYNEPDYRPGSQPLASTGAAFTDAAFTGLIAPCDEVNTPGIMSGTANIFNCSTSVVHTYSIPAISNASSYTWSVPAGATITSGQGTRTITVTYTSTFVTGVISVVGKNDCGNTSAAVTKTIVKIKPGTPVSITGLTNNCSAIGSTATYSTAAVANAETYTWTVPATGASIVSGQGTNSIVVSFTSAYTTGSISVKANSSCYTIGAVRTLAVTKTLPGTPGAMTGAADVCPSFSAPSADSSALVNYKINRVNNASSYEWTAPAGARIVSGQGDSSVFVKFANTFVSGSISVRSVSPCGNSALRALTVYRRVANLPGAVQKSFIPSVLPQLAVCGKTSETYMIRKVAYATSYAWSLKNGANATITSVNGAGPNDTAVVVTFSQGFVSDSLIVRSVTACSQSATRRIFLNTANVTAAVATLTSGTGNFAPCAGATVTYTVTAPAPTNAQSPISTFRWTRPAGTSVASANADSSVVTINYLSTYKGGALSVAGQSACGFRGTARTVTLQYLPPTPSFINGNPTPCINTNESYSFVIVSPSISQAAAVGYSWTLPKNTSIVSANTDSSFITISIGALFTSGSISVKAKTACGVLGGGRSQALTKCVVSPRAFTYTEAKDQLYPNPNDGNFQLSVNTGITTRSNALVRVFDMTGKQVAQYNAVNNNGVINARYAASHLQNGVYTVQYTVGNTSKSIKMIVQK